MKKNYTRIYALFIAASLAFAAFDAKAGYVTVPCTGFTADVVANGLGYPQSTTDSTFDKAGFYLLDSTYRYPTAPAVLPAHALSPSGLIHSVVATTPGLDFQLASFSGANSLRIDVNNSAKTLNFVTPVSASQVFVLGATGSGAATMTVVVNFTDLTSQTFTAQSLPDWFNSTGFAIQGIGRVNPLNSQPTGLTAPTDPRLYQKALTLNAANYTKLISGITVTQTSVTAGVVNIMAVSIQTPPLGINNSNLAAAPSIKLYPNPVSTDFYVELSGYKGSVTEKVSCKIYNMIGEQVFSISSGILEENRFFIKPDTKLAPGIYVLETEVNAKKSLQKFVVK